MPPPSSASELVDWLVQNGEAASREEAVELGQVRWRWWEVWKELNLFARPQPVHVITAIVGS